MDLAIFNSNGFLFLFRWFHLFFGIIWIGLLYYFNFVQGAFFAETDANTKSNAIQKLVPRALWWFRWAAMMTFLTGWVYLLFRGHRDGHAIYATSWGVLILTGATLGSLMWFNVWFVIWPNQKIVIASATDVAKGGKAIPEATQAGARAGVASRTNVMFSIPMLFFMAAASFLPLSVNPETSLKALCVVLGLIFLGIQVNALKGKTGPMTSIRGVITCGFILAAVLYLMIEFLTK